MTRNTHDFTPGAKADRPVTFINLEDLRKTCPSVFATHASPRVSERYTFVSTADILRPLLKEGWGITEARQRHTRSGGRNPEFTRHYLRLRRSDSQLVVGDVFPEVVISNSHDRQCRFFIAGGLFRLACSNGLVLGFGGKDQHAGGIMTHIGDIARIHALIESALKASIGSGKTVSGMMKRKLDERAQAKFAAQAAKVAYEEENPPFDPKLLLTPRRDEDKADDLWTVYNRVQENIVRGGVRYIPEGSKREVVTRGITHIGRSIDLNTSLWDAAVTFLPKVKAAA